MGKESIPRQHHYIPQFYLRGFSDRGFGDKRGRVCVVDLRAKKCFTTSPENIAQVRDFYAFENPEGEVDLRIETQFFNGIDGKAAQIVGKIDRLQPVTLENDWEGLCRFIASLEVRTPSQRQVSYEMQQHMSDLLNSHLATSLDACEERLRQYEAETGKQPTISARELQEQAASHRVEISQNEHVGLMVHLIPTIEANVCRMTPHLLIAGENEHFISSDFPIVKFDTNEERRKQGLMGVGWATPEVEVTIPLTKTRCLVLNWDGKPDVMTVNNQTVAYCNNMQLAMSFQHVFASGEDFCFLTENDGIVRGKDEAFKRFAERKLGHRVQINGGGIPRRPPASTPLKRRRQSE